MRKIAIIPAAGLGSRWGKYPKFILPCGEREWMLDRTIRQFPDDVEKIKIIYGAETITEIAWHLRRTGLLTDKRIELVENENMGLDLWGSVLAGIEESADYYYFAMPDTYFDGGVLAKMGASPITIATFYTETPERFGVIRNDSVVDKAKGEAGDAWGVLGWSGQVRDLWLSKPLSSFPEALSLAMSTYGYDTTKLEYYIDFGSWQEYVAFILWKIKGV